MSQSVLPGTVPSYFELLLQQFDPVRSSRCVHLGYWPELPTETELNESGAFGRAQAALNEQVLVAAAIKDGQSIIDVGCGLGATLAEINKRYQAMKLFGVNIDPRQLDICRTLEAAANNRLVWQQADACELPYPSASIDRVICVEAMFHFASRQQFFAEAARILKPGGRLVATDMTIAPALAQQSTPAFLFEATMVDGYGPWPDFWLCESEYAALAANAGLHLTLQRDISRETLPSYRFTAPSVAAEDSDPGDSAARAALTMHWLHRNNFLQYWLLVLEKPE